MSKKQKKKKKKAVSDWSRPAEGASGMFPVQEEDSDGEKREPRHSSSRTLSKGGVSDSRAASSSGLFRPRIARPFISRRKGKKGELGTPPGTGAHPLGTERTRGRQGRQTPGDTAWCAHEGRSSRGRWVRDAGLSQRAVRGCARPPGPPLPYPWGLTEDTRLLRTLEKNWRHSMDPCPPPDTELLTAHPCGGSGGLLPRMSEGHGDWDMGSCQRSRLSLCPVRPCPACPDVSCFPLITRAESASFPPREQDGPGPA